MNPRLQKTKDALLDALIRLLEIKPLEEITVSELCKEAVINRTTFYKYYAVPEDLIIESAERMLRDVLYVEGGPSRALEDYMLLCCRNMYENRRLLHALRYTRADLTALFFRTAKEGYDVQFLYRDDNIFIAGGVLSLLSAWMHRGFDESPEAVAHKLTGYIQKIIVQEEQV